MNRIPYINGGDYLVCEAKEPLNKVSWLDAAQGPECGSSVFMIVIRGSNLYAVCERCKTEHDILYT